MIKNLLKNKSLFYLAVLSFGISFCFTFQLTNLSSIFRFLGASSASLPLLWLAPPLTGLIIQPLVGQISDGTVSRFGKRRPYIFVWTLIACIGLFMLPFFNSLLAVILLTWIIDSSLNGTTESLRALTGDVTAQNETTRSQAFALQAFSAGIGGAVGTFLPYLLHHLFTYFHVSVNMQVGTLPMNLKVSFVIVAIILGLSLPLVMRIKEKTLKYNNILTKKPQNFVQNVGKIFADLFYNIRKMPVKFRQTCLIHAISWVGIFIFWLYFTTTIAKNVYGLPLNADTTGNPAYADLLQKASLDSSIYFGIYQYVSIVYAILLFFFSTRMKVRLLHAGSLLIGGCAIALVSFESSNWAIITSMVGVGIMWGSMSVLPYTLAMQYIPKGKVGIYLGIFNMSITAPQIICGLLLTPLFNTLLKGFTGYVLLIAGIFILYSAGLWIKQEHKRHMIRRAAEKADYSFSS